MLMPSATRLRMKVVGPILLFFTSYMVASELCHDKICFVVNKAWTCTVLSFSEPYLVDVCSCMLIEKVWNCIFYI